MAAKLNFFNIVEYLVKHLHQPINAQNTKGLSPLHYACRIGSMQITRFLIKEGAEGNLQSYSGLNSLHYACKFGMKQVVLYLLEKVSFDINQPTYVARNTPLHLACMNGHEGIVQILLDEGADPTIVNVNQEDGLSIAIQQKNVSIAKLMIEGYDFNYSKLNLRTGLSYFSYAVLKNCFNIADMIKEHCQKEQIELNCNQ